ncbi:MAG: hypothetical protein H0X73_06785 [Chthoniobacterales bacterium]|nr:hypothetical protein [Chthoniobacterales bacterium]
MNSFVRDLIAVIGMACWPVCFWWMHRISARQNAVLRQLHDQGRRIENVSKEEHNILKELHPAVQNIEESVAQQAPSPEP